MSICVRPSANASNAATVAKALGVRVIALTGPSGGALGERADIALRLPGDSTWAVQESHIATYHALCRAVEAAFFPEPR